MSDRNLQILESPEYKRRWFRSAGAYDATNLDDDKILEADLKAWLLDRLESSHYWPEPRLQSAARIADLARRDGDFLQVAELYTDTADFDLTDLITRLCSGEAVPYLPVLRYKSSGLRIREQWERTWELQRRQDQGLAVGTIPVPPKYKSSDFLSSDSWRLRGKLDVPKERFVSYPGAEREADRTPVFTWAGFNHLEQATALSGYYIDRKDDGWERSQLQPLLAGLLELLPWILQWHNQLDPDTDHYMGDFYRLFIEGQAAELGFTLDQVRNWAPEVKPRGRGRKA